MPFVTFAQGYFSFGTVHFSESLSSMIRICTKSPSVGVRGKMRPFDAFLRINAIIAKPF